MLAFIDQFRQGLKQRTRRAYYARREAEALRMQYGAKAEAWCDEKLSRQNIPERRERYLKLVRKALEGL